MLQVSELYIYPIKSLGGIALNSVEVTDRGFKYDRRWMLVDGNNRFVSQREFPKMALLKVAVNFDGLTVVDSQTSECLTIPFHQQTDELCIATVWDEPMETIYVSKEADIWFSKILGFTCRLVYMPDHTTRHVDEKYAPAGFINSFADGYPFLIIGQASLDDLNSRLKDPLPINRFRPNIVFTGGQPFEEDQMQSLAINEINFNGVKLCARCIIITINQNTLVKNKEPLKTLATYRRRGNDVLFGQNLIHTGSGFISVGDEINVKDYHTEERFFLKA
jgi:uncharacterized protein YcbX